MKESYEIRLQLFADNTLRVKKEFAWHNQLIHRLAALLYAVEDRTADVSAIRNSYELIKKSTGLFSTFRGNSAITIATLLSLSLEKEKQLEDTLTVYNMLKNAKFRASDYLAIAAYQIALNTEPDQYQIAIARAQAFYESMKANHRFHTGQDDYIYAAMLALSDIEVESAAARMEELYATLKPHFLSGNSVQALTQVLVLGDKASETATDLLILCDAFRKKGIRLDKQYTLSSLGVLSLLPCDSQSVVEEVAKTCEWLRTKKGFGSWSITKQELLLLSAALVAYNYAEEVNSGILTTTLSTSMTNIIIAQQAAIAVAAASATAASSSSSS
ncbi:hypothetical protein D3C81_849540 [compost metagenome]